MGIDIKRRDFTPADYQRFSERLDTQLDELRTLLGNPGFGEGASTLGSELELYVVDAAGRPIHLNHQLLDKAADPQLTLEINRYNLELNLTPQRFTEQGLSATEAEINHKLAGLGAIAEVYEVGVVPIGILPTLRASDFGAHCLTDRERYHALVAQLMSRRGADFHIDIDGPEPLELSMANITLEGANTSFQVHWRVAPEDYAASFNALQLVTPLVLAIGANSPGIFGHTLWEETRIPLFKQSIDTRHLDPYSWHEPARVSFGQGWVREGPMELFEEAVRLYPPLLPCLDDGAAVDARVPALAELRLHQSTVWLWNRPVYDDSDGGHLRIEMRALPAGPTAADMVANAALYIGLAAGLRQDMPRLLAALPFALAERNFYRAAQLGLDAEIVWPRLRQHALEAHPVWSLLASLLPRAAAGLAALGVSATETDRYLGIIERRLAARVNGARWQRQTTAALEAGGVTRSAALAGMLARYRQLFPTNLPVAEWPG